jgi:hypothetical protein
MKRILLVAVIALVSNVSFGQDCANGQCQPVKTAIVKANELTSVLVNKYQHTLKVATVKCQAVAKRDGVGRKLLGKVSSMIRRGR